MDSVSDIYSQIGRHAEALELKMKVTARIDDLLGAKTRPNSGSA